MACNLLINGVYWGYNPLTNLLLTSWDIQVTTRDHVIHCDVTVCWVGPFVFEFSKWCLTPSNWATGSFLKLSEVNLFSLRFASLFFMSWHPESVWHPRNIPGRYSSTLASFFIYWWIWGMFVWAGGLWDYVWKIWQQFLVWTKLVYLVWTYHGMKLRIIFRGEHPPEK